MKKISTLCNNHLIDYIHPPLDKTKQQFASNLLRFSIDNIKQSCLLCCRVLTSLRNHCNDQILRYITLPFTHYPMFFSPHFIYTNLVLTLWIFLNQGDRFDRLLLFILNFMNHMRRTFIHISSLLAQLLI